MDESVKNNLLSWMSRILDFNVTFTDIQSGSALIQLANMTGDVQLPFSDLKSFDALESFKNHLDAAYTFPASSLFDLQAAVSGTSSDEEVFAVCMLVLLNCLQSRSRQHFMEAALDLDPYGQLLIFCLVHEPMTQLSHDQHLTRECILAALRDSVTIMQHILPQKMTTVDTEAPTPSTIVIPDVNTEATPIKSASVVKDLRQSWCGSNEEDVLNGTECNENTLHRSWSVGLSSVAPVTTSSSPAQRRTDKSDVPNYSPIFRAPEPFRRKKKKSQRSEESHGQAIRAQSETNVTNETELYSGGPSDDDSVAGFGILRPSTVGYSLSPSTLPPPPPPIASNDAAVSSSNVRLQRPSELKFMCTNYNPQFSRHMSQSNSLIDLNDIPVGQKSNPHPPASPLASLKDWLDSPLWTHKTRLREVEREKRRLIAELEKERTYRDEVESVVAELRCQLDKERQRATEAESRATRLSRDLTVLQDQADELTSCRADLAAREIELTNLKKRMNSFQDLLARSRKLELENANLQEECADHKQKIEQLSSKLSEIKDRRMVCSEVETLRSKLRDVEVQLAQQLLERETAEKDARRQQELYSQLKLQHAMLEKYRTHVIRRPSDSKPFSSQSRLNGLHSGDEIECEDTRLVRTESKDSLTSTNSTHTKLKVDPIHVSDGENLGSVLESELRLAHTESSKMKDRLDEILSQLRKREQEVIELSERVQQLTMDLASSSAQCELSHQASDEARAALTGLQDDLATLEGRLIWARSMNQKHLDEIHQTSCIDVVAQIESTGILDRIKGIGTGLPTTLGQLCQLFTANLEDVWALIMGHLSRLQDTIAELHSVADHTKRALCQKEAELTKITSESEERSKYYTQQLVAEQNKLAKTTEHLASLEKEHDTNNRLVTELKTQVDMLMHEKNQLINDRELLQEQSSREMRQSKELLEEATKRLCELEKELESKEKNEKRTDVATQTDDVLSQLSLPLEESPLIDSLYRSDVDEDIRHQGEEDRSLADGPPEDTYTALAADRRGLSDELVRLHDELNDSEVDRHNLQQHVIELQNQLADNEMKLRRQTALYSRAQDQWLLADREARDAKKELSRLRAELTAEHQAMLRELSHTRRFRSEASATVSQIEAVRLKYESERDDLKNKLFRATGDLERLETERNRLIEFNTLLQRELTTTRRLADVMTQGPSYGMSRNSSLRERRQVAKALRAALRNPHTPSGDTLEEWLKSITPKGANHHGTSFDPDCQEMCEATAVSDSPSGTSSQPYELEDTEDDDDVQISVAGSQLANYKCRNVPNPHSSRYGVYSGVSRTSRSRGNRCKSNRHSEEIARQVERLTSQTDAIETLALNLQQNVSEQLQRTSAPIASSTLCTMPHMQHPQSNPFRVPNSDNPHSVSLGGPLTNGLDSAGLQNPASAPVQFPPDPNPGGASSTHENHDLDTDADSSAFTDLSQVSSASRHGQLNTDQASSPQQHSLFCSGDLSRMSVNNLSASHHTDSDYSIRQTKMTQRPQSLNCFNGNLQGRSEFLTKMSDRTKASPIETDPSRIAELNRRNRLQPMHLRTSYPVETQTVNPEKVVNTLRQLSSVMRGKAEVNGFGEQNSSAPVSEDHRTVLREVIQENVRDTHSENQTLSSGLTRGYLAKSNVQSERGEGIAAGYRPVPKNLNSITDALIAASDDPSVMAAALEAQLARAALIKSKNECNQKPKQAERSRSPSTLSIQSIPGSINSDKQNTSCAFEILIKPASKSRRLPPPRLASSTIIRRPPRSKCSNI